MLIERTFCPNCKSREIFRNGSSDGRKRIVCRECRKSFYSKSNAFHRHKFPEQAILRALFLANSGNSPREIRAALASEGISVSRQTIFSWRKKFSGKGIF